MTPDDVLSDEFFEARKRELETRVRRRRFEHSLGVSDTAGELARTYGADERLARLAGLLHDWDKGYDDAGIRARAREVGYDTQAWIYENMPNLLHGPTAARALARTWPELPRELLHAIEVHTTGALDMSDLDMIVYVADAIEPSRVYPGIEHVRSLVAHVPLEELFLTTFQDVLVNLVSRRKRVYPKTLEIWNHYIDRARQRAVAEAKPRKERS